MPNLTIDFDAVGGSNPIHVDFNDQLSTAAAKQNERDEINQQIEEFLASGGVIEEVPPNVMADPPQKPASNYGSQPI